MEMGIAIQQDNAFSEFTHRVQDQLNAKLWEVLKHLAMPQNYHTFGPIKKMPKPVHSSQMARFRWIQYSVLGGSPINSLQMGDTNLCYDGTLI